MSWLNLAKLSVAVIILSAIALTSGCGDGVALTRRERQERDRQIFENDMRQIVDDWDTFWLNDSPTRLSRWRIR